MDDTDDDTNYIEQAAEQGRQLFQSRVAQPSQPQAIPLDLAPRAPPQADPNSQPFSLAPMAPAAAQAKPSLWRDFADSAWTSTVAMGSEAVSAASFATRELTGNPQAVAWLEQQRQSIDGYLNRYVANLAPDEQHALRSSLFGGKTENGEQAPTPGEVGWTQWAASTLGSFVPTVALAMLPGSLAAKVAIKLGAAAGGATAAGLATTGAAFGTTQAGSAYKTLVDTLDGASEKDMMENPTYAHLRQSGMGDIDAKKTLAGQAAPFILAQFGVGAATGAGVGGLMTRGAMGAAGSTLGRRALVGAGEGAATMATQAGGQNFLEQRANMQLGPQKEFDKGQLARTVASGALGGALVGGLSGAVHAHGAPPEAPPVEAAEAQSDIVAPGVLPADTSAALDAALNPANRTVVQPGTPTAPQGELFQPFARQPGMSPGATQPGLFPEPAGDIAAQISAMNDPANPKDAVFVAPGNEGSIPAKLPDQVQVLKRPEGTLLTTNPAKAQLFQAPQLSDAHMAQILDYPEEKGAALASSSPTVVQGRDAQGNVVHESVASPAGVPAAVAAASARAPNVTTLTPEQALARRAAPRPSDGMTRQDMIDGLATTHGLNPKTLKNMSLNDLRARYDKMMPAQQAQTPAQEDTTGLVAGLGGAGKAIGDNLRDMLWDKFQRGDTTEVSQPSRVLTAAHQARSSIPDRAAFDEFVQRFASKKPAPPVDAPAAPVEAPATTGVPFMITQAMKANLRIRGYSDEAISHMTPAQAHAALSESVAAPTPAAPSPAQAKRAAQKAQMAKPGEPQRGVSATVEAPITARPTERAEHSYMDVRADANDALRLDVPAGARHVASKELAEFVAKVDKTEHGIYEAIARWGDSNPNPLPGAGRLRRADIANLMLRRLTGRDLSEFRGGPRFGVKEIRDEARQPSVYEREGVAKATDLEDKMAEGGSKLTAEDAAADRALSGTDHTVEGEEPSQGVASYGAEKPRSAKTTNLDRKLSDLESKVINGLMTAKEADAAYGRKVGVGTSRTYPRFSDWVQSRIEKEAAKNLDKQRPAYIKQLLDMQRELAPPSRGLIHNYTRAARDPVVVKPVADLLERTHAEGKSASIHAYLDAIAGSRDIQQRLPAVVAFARRLRSMLPAKLQVMSDEVATHKFGSKYSAPDAAGRYWLPQEGRDAFISLNRNVDRGLLETVLHEGLHAVTNDYIEKLRRYPHQNERDAQALAAIHDELQSAFKTARGLTANEREDIEYALQDPHELHTMLMTSPVVQQFAAEHTPSDGFRARMRELGYEPQAWRSGWAAFKAFVRRALGLKGPSTGPDASFFDHILRPLEEITDRAAEGMPADPVLRRAAEPVADVLSHALPTLRGTRDDVVRRIDPSGISDKMRRALLVAERMDGMVKWYGPLFTREGVNHLKAFRDANEAVGKAQKDYHDANDEAVGKLIAAVRGPDRDKVAKLLIDSTLAETNPAPGGRDNAHLTTPEQQAALRSLQGRFNALDARGKAAFRAIRDYYDKEHVADLAAQAHSLVRKTLPDATPAQAAALADVLKSKAAIEELIANPDAGPVAQAFADKWGSSRKLVQSIAKIQNYGFVRGLYFPLRRFGDYVVHYGDRDNPESYGVEMFEKRSDAEARRSELLRQGVADVSQVKDKRNSRMRDSLTTPVVDELVSGLKRSGWGGDAADEVRDLANNIMLQHNTRSAEVRSRMQRQGVRGASTEIEKVLAQDFLHTATRRAWLEKGPDRDAALAGLRQHVDYLDRNGGANDQIKALAVLNEIEKRYPTGDDATGAFTNLARKATSLGYVQSLMSFSHMITSSMEAHTNSVALLGARHGPRAPFTLANAMRQIAPGMVGTGVRNSLMAFSRAGLKAADWNLSNVVRDRLIRAGADREHMNYLFNQANNAGLIDHTMTREFMRIAYPGADVTRGVWQRFLDFNGAGAHAVDVMNKGAILKAAFDLEMRKSGGDYKRATDYAVETARQAMPNYNLANKNRVSRGVLAPMMQFKQYGFHMYSILANLAHTSVAGASRSERNEARIAFAGLLATHAMMAGAITLVADPIRYVMGAYDMFFGDGDKPHDYQNDVRSWIASIAGPELGEVISRGLPHLAGIDVHRRVGLANLLEVPELESFKKEGFMKVLGSALTGASAEDAATMTQGLVKMTRGNLMAGVQDLVPRVFRDPMKAAKLANVGITDSTGKTVLAPEKLSSADIAAQAVGFQPSTVTEFREGRAAVMEAREEVTFRRSQLLHEFVQADPEDRSDIVTQVNRFNEMHPGSKITYTQLLQAIQRQRTASRQTGNFGLKLPAKAARELSAAGDFANVQ